MSLFSLPLDSSSIRQSSRARFHPRTSKKRKRLSSTHVEFNLYPSEPPPEQSSLPAASTNPLSLTPDEVYQYRVAGLDLDKELPSKSIPDFPHRALPASFPPASEVDHAVQTDDDGTEIESGNLQRDKRAPHLRMQHVGVLTTILQRCLLEGDIPRASRAWAMLLRAQHHGKGIDIRSSGYWGIGAELLIRGDEKPARGRLAFSRDDSLSSQSDGEDSSSDDEGEVGEGRKHEQSERRWGSASGLEKAKDYYERLILQYPYVRQYPTSFEQKEVLRKIAIEEQSDDIIMADNSSDEDENLRSGDPDAFFAAQQRREAHQHARKRDIIWKKRDQIRNTALGAAEKVAARMDNLMATPPYSDSHVLQKLRGMLALYIGDISVPDLFEADIEQEEEEDGDHDGSSDMHDALYGKRSERRLLWRNRRAEHERGLAKRSEEWARAQRAFEKIQRDGGQIDVGIATLTRADS